MSLYQAEADRILSHGGMFVIFADSRNQQDLIRAYQRGSSIVPLKDIEYDNWSILSNLSRLDVEYDEGREISVEIDRETALGQLLAEHTREARFACTLRAYPPLEDRWITLAKNKYGLTFAGIIVPKTSDEGAVFIFPQLRDKPRFLVKLFNGVLPDFAPRLTSTA